MVNSAKVVFKINGVIDCKSFNQLPFGRKIEYYKAIEAFKTKAKSVYISQKHRTFKAALKEAIDLYDAAEYYCLTHDSPTYRDDSFEFFYISKQS